MSTTTALLVGDDIARIWAAAPGPSEETLAAMAAKPDPTSLEAQTLLGEMHRLSEERWAAGWRDGLEYLLWAAIEAYGKGAATADVSLDEATELAQLAVLARGWWIHCSRVGRAWESGDAPGRVFLTLADWRAMYAAGAELAEET